MRPGLKLLPRLCRRTDEKRFIMPNHIGSEVFDLPLHTVVAVISVIAVVLPILRLHAAVLVRLFVSIPLRSLWFAELLIVHADRHLASIRLARRLGADGLLTLATAQRRSTLQTGVQLFRTGRHQRRHAGRPVRLNVRRQQAPLLRARPGHAWIKGYVYVDFICTA